MKKPDATRQGWPESPYTIIPPLYAASAQVVCWHCQRPFTAVCLLASGLEAVPGPASFLSVAELPEEAAAFLRQHYPAYQSLPKLGAYGNVCPACQSLTGDHFLIREPDGAFFPLSEEAASQISLREIPVSGKIIIDAGVRWGSEDLILQRAQRIG